MATAYNKGQGLIFDDGGNYYTDEDNSFVITYSSPVLFPLIQPH